MSEWRAEIISIGNELLSGKTINTNASHIAKRLTSLGYTVRRITTVGDYIDDIVSAFREAINRRPLLIISTGGLGPTYDDKTAEALAIALEDKLVENPIALEMIVEKYRRRNIEITPERRKMAYMPSKAIPVENNQGIAPGIYIIYNNIEILATPGVPREMEDVLENFIRKYLKNKPNVKYYEETFEVEGVMESTIAPYVKELVNKYNLYIKTHPKGYEVQRPYIEVQIAGSGDEKVRDLVKECKEELIKIFLKLGGKLRSQ
ncbi:MAG: nicotinamide mononucleotide deamidase-related protein [Sulfolobaceae archaeon]